VNKSWDRMRAREFQRHYWFRGHPPEGGLTRKSGLLYEESGVSLLRICQAPRADLAAGSIGAAKVLPKLPKAVKFVTSMEFGSSTINPAVSEVETVSKLDGP